MSRILGLISNLTVEYMALIPNVAVECCALLAKEGINNTVLKVCCKTSVARRMSRVSVIDIYITRDAEEA